MSRPKDPTTADEEFDAQTITAVGEAFNNIAIHGYSAGPGDVDIEIEFENEQILIRMMDTGLSFDPSTVPEPALEELPESGMGLFIMNSFMDEVTYTAGNPNVLCMIKRRGGRPDGIGSNPPGDNGGSGPSEGWRMMGAATSNRDAAERASSRDAAQRTSSRDAAERTSNPTSSSDRSGV